jgi:uncharacterized protein GlcG (DUF336 family)
MAADLGVEHALELLAGAHRRAGELGINVATCVVDGGANTVAFARMDGTQLASHRIAAGKAYTALAWRRKSGELWEIAQPGEGGFGINTIDSRFVLSAGGIPILREGDIIGAIGVSGGTAEQDEECATAAVESVSR